MSTFMVRDDTINRVVAWLSWEVTRSDWLKRKLEQALHLDTATHNFEAELGQAMFCLNIDGVNGWYGEGAEKFRKLNYRYTAAHGSETQVLKSMQCWLYQCMEGEVVKTALYQFFDAVVEKHLLESIIMALPEYNRAEWGRC